VADVSDEDRRHWDERHTRAGQSAGESGRMKG
jgi:hypothetical protein